MATRWHSLGQDRLHRVGKRIHTIRARDFTPPQEVSSRARPAVQSQCSIPHTPLLLLSSTYFSPLFVIFSSLPSHPFSEATRENPYQYSSSCINSTLYYVLLRQLHWLVGCRRWGRWYRERRGVFKRCCGWHWAYLRTSFPLVRKPTINILALVELFVGVFPALHELRAEIWKNHDELCLRLQGAELWAWVSCGAT